MKCCNKCGIEKSINDFSRDSWKKDGIRSICKKCEAERGRLYRKNNHKKIKERKRDYYILNQEKLKAKRQKYYKNKRKERTAYQREYNKSNPQIVAAHSKVANAKKRSDLPPLNTCVCVDCGNRASDYHHSNYSEPLEVVPLCRSCHLTRHRTPHLDYQPPRIVHKGRLINCAGSPVRKPHNRETGDVIDTSVVPNYPK